MATLSQFFLKLVHISISLGLLTSKFECEDPIMVTSSSGIVVGLIELDNDFLRVEGEISSKMPNPKEHLCNTTWRGDCILYATQEMVAQKMESIERWRRG